jgi:CheY-like chemotaxis protein
VVIAGIAVTVFLGMIGIWVFILRPSAAIVRTSIAELGEKNAALDRALLEAEHAAKVKSEFLATVSHELRTSLNAVIGLSGLLADTTLDARQQVFVSTINHSGDALLGLINSILDLAKIEAGRLDLEVLDFDVCELVETAAETLAFRAEGERIEVATNVAANVPSRVSGPGLDISRRLVELTAGTIGLTSEPQRGSTWPFDLPLGPVEDRVDDISLLVGRRILIVDDLAANRLLRREVVLGWKMMPDEVVDAEAALRALRDAAEGGRAFDVALLDFEMPRTDGYGFARLIGEDATIARTPLILISSYSDSGDPARVAAAGLFRDGEQAAATGTVAPHPRRR